MKNTWQTVLVAENSIKKMIEQFKDHKFINLETFKKDGSSVKTPLWFVQHEGVLYMRTPMTTWKVKRIRNNPQVRVAPSDAAGNDKGEWLPGRAEVHPAEEMAWVNDLVIRKYGLLKRVMDWRNRLLGRAGNFAVIAVRVDTKE
jgi:PPOX class probable F420-dependent enzyme